MLLTGMFETSPVNWNWISYCWLLSVRLGVRTWMRLVLTPRQSHPMTRYTMDCEDQKMHCVGFYLSEFPEGVGMVHRCCVWCHVHLPFAMPGVSLPFWYRGMTKKIPPRTEVNCENQRMTMMHLMNLLEMNPFLL